MRVALTFDVEHPDRPTVSGVTERLVEVLDSRGVISTMFIQGRWAQAYPRLTEQIAMAGHLVGNHSHFHARMPSFNDSGLASDVRSAGAAIRDACGVNPTPWFRCPFGAGSDDERVLRGLAKLGYRDVGWHVDSKDWAARGPKALVERVVARTLEHGDGAVVLMHGWPRWTPDAVGAIVDRLRSEDAAFVTIDQLEELPGNRPETPEVAAHPRPRTTSETPETPG
ncbi:MAG: peptidoglycan-N-acetylglucosamine deacetylase [Chloroflexota bacterium]|nr:peptidoglycan-N-acetylglucosamine deacetylase [Chloroflexota bacterium]